MNQHDYLHRIQAGEARLLRAITRMVGWQVELGDVPTDEAVAKIEQHRREGMEIAQSTTDVAGMGLDVTLEWTAPAYERLAVQFEQQAKEQRKK